MRRVVLAGLLVAGALVPSQSFAAAHGAAPSWSLLLVTAGHHGASDVRLLSNVKARETGAEPLVIGDVFADRPPRQPGFVSSLIVQQDGGPAQINLAGPIGHRQVTLSPSGAGQLTFGSTGEFSRLVAGEQIAELSLFAGGGMTRSHLSAAAGSGSVTVKRVYGTGAQALYLADGGDAGPAIDADVAAAGSSTHELTARTGLAGGLVDFDVSQQTAAERASWTSPGGESGSVTSLVVPTSGCGIGQPTFAGGSGRWKWSWQGVSQQFGQLGIAAWAPVGAYWHYFRAPSGAGPGVCLPVIDVPIG